MTHKPFQAASKTTDSGASFSGLNTPDHTADSADHAYALAVIMKNCQCDEREARSKLKSVDEAALVVAGRAGRVAECRAMLGCV